MALVIMIEARVWNECGVDPSLGFIRLAIPSDLTQT
jgi:hypothetical protein